MSVPATPAPLRTLTVGQSWPSVSPGGLNRYVADLHTALPAAGVAPTVVALGPLSEPVDGVTEAAPESANILVRLAGLYRAVARRLPTTDVVVSHFALYGALPVLLARLRRVPVVVHFHGPWAGEGEAQGESGRTAMIKHWVERRVYHQADALVVVSAAFRELVIDEYGVAPERVHVITPGVDLDRFDVDPGAGDQPSGAFTAFSVRRLVPRMGLDVLIDAWPDDPDATLMIAGDGPERAALTARAAGKDVRFLGRVSDEELRGWYCRADVVVVPSVALEGFGLVVLEALACGTPVLASRTGGLTEVLPMLGDDLLVEPGDVGAWAHRLVRARAGGLPDRQDCRRLATRFGTRAFAANVADIYRSAAAKRRG